MRTLEQVEAFKDHLESVNPDAVLFDGLDLAIVGIAERFNLSPVVAYDYDACIEMLVESGMSPEAALEWLEFNVTGAWWVGKDTPVFVHLRAPSCDNEENERES